MTTEHRANRDRLSQGICEVGGEGGVSPADALPEGKAGQE